MANIVKVTQKNLYNMLARHNSRLIRRQTQLPDFSNLYDHKLTEFEYKKLSDIIRTKGSCLKALNDGKKLYKLETQQGTLLAKVKNKEVTQVSFPGFFSQNDVNKFNYKNGESRTQYIKRTTDFEKDETKILFHSTHYYPNGNGWRDSLTGKPPKEYMDKNYTTIKSRRETWLTNGGNSSELVQSVTADGKVQHNIARRYEWVKTIDENKYVSSNLDGTYSIFHNGKKMQGTALKDKDDALMGFRIENQTFLPAELMKILHLPEKWGNEIAKAYIKLLS